MPARALRDETPVVDPERMVVECCAAGAPAVVTLHDAGQSVRAAFTAFRNERVELELMDEACDGTPPGGSCHVSFLYRGRPMFFVSVIEHVGPESGTRIVRLHRPDRVTGESVRAAFRIPAGAKPPAVEVVGDDGAPSAAALVNLSLTGMLVRFTKAPPLLWPDQVVELVVHVDDEPIRLAGVVRRSDETEAAFFFPDAVSEAPENPIRRAVAALERDWHARLRR